jgi:hypothetical protein
VRSSSLIVNRGRRHVFDDPPHNVFDLCPVQVNVMGLGDLGNTANRILASNGSTDAIDDIYDANKAGQNTWFGNSFTTANQSYIH